jgi:hypothetical protein
MEIIVKLLTLHKLNQKKALILRKTLNNLPKSSSITKILLKLGMKLKNTKNTQAQLRFQIMSYLQILIGEMLMELISLTHIEIKVTVVLATLSLSPKLLK